MSMTPPGSRRAALALCVRRPCTKSKAVTCGLGAFCIRRKRSSGILLDKPGEAARPFILSSDQAVVLLRDAVEHAKKAGLPWMETELVLTPSPQLAELVRRSQELAASSAEAGEGEG